MRNFLKYVRDGTKDRNWPVVLRSSLVPALKIGATLTSLNIFGKTLFVSEELNT